MTANDDENSPTDADLAAIWQDAPATDMVPFLEGAEKNALAESGAIIYVVGMTYVNNSKFGPRFGATLVTPSGEKRYMTMKSAGGSTPRDQTNKWLLGLFKAGETREVPAVIVKRGQAFMFDRPPTVG